MDKELMKQLAMNDIGLTEEEAEQAVDDYIESESVIEI